MSTGVTMSEHTCELCGEIYPSLRAAWMCEDRDVAEAREARRPSTRILRPASQRLEE